MSVSGTFDGTPVDAHCTSTDLPRVLWANPDRWPIACRDTTTVPGHELRYQVDVPMEPPKDFFHAMTLGNNPLRANVNLTNDDEGGDATADHFSGGRMGGRIELDPVTGHDLIVGTFTGRWGAPATNCDGGLAAVCRPMELNGTFYLENHLKIEDFP
jgi:hypothetical protein